MIEIPLTQRASGPAYASQAVIGDWRLAGVITHSRTRALMIEVIRFPGHQDHGRSDQDLR